MRRWALVTALASIVWVALFSVSLMKYVPELPVNDFAPARTTQVSSAPDAQMIEVLAGPASGRLPATGANYQPHDHARAAPVINTCKPAVVAPGSALANAQQRRPLSVFAMLPNTPVGAFRSFVDNCAEVDVLVPDWFEIGGDAPGLTSVSLDPDLIAAIAPIFGSNVAAPLLLPAISLSHKADRTDFLNRLGAADFRARLVDEVGTAIAAVKAAGVCLTLDFPATADLSGVEALLKDLQRDFQLTGSQLCTILTAESDLWQRPGIASASDYVIVKMFGSPWIGSAPRPLSPDDRFLETAFQISKTVGPKKFVPALGLMAVDWVSGQTKPETISFAEAMVRIDAAGGKVEFAQNARNSYSRFVDTDGLRHQIWFLDAASAHNSLIDLEEMGIAQIGLSDLGQEDPAVWAVLAGFDTDRRDLAQDLQNTSLSDKVQFKGQGSFYQWSTPPRTGQRLIRKDPDSGKIIDQNWTVLPQPAVMQKFGRGNGVQVALTFDDGPSLDATTEILDALKAADAPAAFFVVGNAVLKYPELVRRMVQEGHLVGTHTFTHPKLGEIEPWRMQVELSATNRLVAGITGHDMRVFRPPYVRGDGPFDGREARVFGTVAERGYIVAGSDIAPPDWDGISAEQIVDRVIGDLDLGYGNVIVLHDGRSKGMNTAEAIGPLVKALRDRGYQIVPLAEILGTTTAALMPATNVSLSGFDSASFGAIMGLTQLIYWVFWLVLISGMARSLIYLFLAHRRETPGESRLRVLPSVTIVIPAFNESLVILSSIRTALASSYPNLRVIVVDDGSTDDTLRLVRRAYGIHPAVTILTQPNQGKWMALNAAYEAMESEIAVCMDADTEIAPDAVFHLVQPFVDSRVGAVAGTILVGNKRNILTRLQALEYFTTQNIGRRAQDHINGIIVVPGALGAWRVEAVRDIGMLSNETLTEDTDLTMWMLRNGYTIAYAERATGRTEAPADVRSLLAQRLRWNTGILQALWKHKGIFRESPSLRLASLADLIIFGYVLPFLAPLVDVIFFTLLFGVLADVIAGQAPDLSNTSRAMMLGYILLPLADILMILAAFRFDRRESMRLLWVWPLQNLFYRQLIYVSALRAVISAISGRLTGWDKLTRHGMGQTKAMKGLPE
ncbi:MAG: glycosyltransferase [Pseudotabrizicola sp.]|uniref:glycosyltransferase n=3 Tax=Pseudotabrizicola sp. TaxID=2939647 RepID=UPI0027306393|nr:glycosyltransferase [Pseudotabrizicola sp.]MDZ7573104.1 glycosyltransferase [Pseudotabrizicola sp.]